MGTLILGFDAKRLFNNTTGLGNYSRTLLRNLQSYFPENEYYLYSPTIGGLPVAEEFLKAPYHHVIPRTNLNPLWRGRGVVSDLLRDQVKLYHGLSHQIPSGLKSTGIKSVVTIHDLIFKRYPKTYKALDRAIYAMKIGHGLEHADAIVAISKQTKRDILEFYPTTPAEKIHVIYQVCDPVFYERVDEAQVDATRKSLQLPADYLLYVGAFTARKNLLCLIQAYHQARLDVPLVLVGNGRRYLKRLKALIRKLKLGKRIIFLHDIRDTQQLRHIYAGARAFVYPSWYEGFGLPVAEALLSKIPVITSNVSSLPEAAGPSSLLIDPHQADDLANAMKKVLDIDREEVTQAGYTYAMEHFSPEKTARQMIELYQKSV